jgi:hypothetical protein
MFDHTQLGMNALNVDPKGINFVFHFLHLGLRRIVFVVIILVNAIQDRFCLRLSKPTGLQLFNNAIGIYGTMDHKSQIK